MGSGPATTGALGETVAEAPRPALAPDPVPGAGPAGSTAVRERPVATVARWPRLLDLVRDKNTLALLDQAVVSGTSFLTTILVGRWCGAGELGVYSLGFSLLVGWACVQESLVALPYTVHRHRARPETEAEYAGGALVQQGLLSALALVALAAGAAALSWDGAVPGLAAVTWVLAAVTPFALLRDFGRRFSFAHLRMSKALALDVAVAAVQLAGLAWLASAGALSAATAYAAIGTACALTAAAWLYLSREHFVIHWRQGWPRMRQSWSLGKWLFGSETTLLVQGYFVHWLLAWSLGPAATGVYAACLTVVLFANPLILGFSNFLVPRAALAFSHGGGPELRRVVARATLLLAAAMAVFCLAVLFGGETLMGLLYRGSQYQGYGHTVTVLAVAMLASAVGMPASSALIAIERPDVVFKVGLVAVVLSVALVPCLVLGWGVSGAAYGFLACNVAGSLGRWLAFAVLVGRAGGGKDLRAGVAQVLRQLDRDLDRHAWVIEQVNEGAQAGIFSVRRKDGGPVWQNERELTVKLYKPATRPDDALVGGQFEALARLQRQLGGGDIDGWRIHVPVPLFLCRRPLALVMTTVPGSSVNTLLAASEGIPAATSASIVRAVVAAMERYWLVDSQIYGDLNFDNILWDDAGRGLSFVDPGVVEEGFLCEGVSRTWHPASRDLAYMLYDAGVAVKRTLRHPDARRRQQGLVEAVLRVFLEKAAAGGRQEGLLDEIHACVQVHLNRLRPSWSPRGLWHLFLRPIAARRIDAILGRLRAGAVTARGDEPGQDGRGRILLGVFEALDCAGIPYCVLHGYEDYPRRIKSDVDCLVSPAVRPGQLAKLFQENRACLGAEVVRFRGYYFVLAGKNSDGSPCFLELDLGVNHELEGRRYYAAAEVLESRRRCGAFWVPDAKFEFGSYLVKKVVKASLDDEQGRRLSELYRQAPARCRQQIARFWGARSAALLTAAAESGDWRAVRGRVRRLRAQLRRGAALRHPLRLACHRLHQLAGRLRRAVRPDSGLEVVFLGPDGAGKSSVVAAVVRQMAGAFARTARKGFPPALLRRLLGRPEGPDKLPHALPPRSLLASALRAVGYWFVHASVGYYLTTRPALARATLVLHDRHLVDVLVDPRRYRYGGPGWLLRLLWRLVPGPDLVILLDAPPEVLQARKQEVPFSETARQRQAYRALVGGMKNGHVVDAGRPLGQVVADVNDIILRHLAARAARRLGGGHSA